MSGILRPFEGGADFTLSPAEVHVWHADLAGAEEHADQCLGLLVPEERARAARLRISEDRAQFVVAHAIARALLGRYLGYREPLLRVAAAANGKPYLAAGPIPNSLRFNASRTKGHAAFAFASGREVGIDIERLERQKLLPELYDRALSAREREWIGALPAEAEHARSFYSFWVRKEAVLKARGDGLATSPSDIEALTQNGSVVFPDDRDRIWRYEDLALTPDCAAAVAAEGADWRVTSQRTFTLGTDQLA